MAPNLAPSRVSPVLAIIYPPEPATAEAFCAAAKNILFPLIPAEERERLALRSNLPSACVALASRLAARLALARLAPDGERFLTKVSRPLFLALPNVSFSYPVGATFCLFSPNPKRVMAIDVEKPASFNFASAKIWAKNLGFPRSDSEMALTLWQARETAIKFSPSLSSRELNAFLRGANVFSLRGQAAIAGSPFFWRRLYWRDYALFVSCDADQRDSLVFVQMNAAELLAA